MPVKKKVKKVINAIVSKKAVNEIVEKIAEKLKGIKYGYCVDEELEKLRELFR